MKYLIQFAIGVASSACGIGIVVWIADMIRRK